MRSLLPILPLVLFLAGCSTPPKAPTAHYEFWRSDAAPATYACGITPDTREELAALVRAAIGPAGLYEDSGHGALTLSARLDVGRPRMTEVERWSDTWRLAGDDRRFVEIIDRSGRPVVVPATHRYARHASRWAVLLSRSTLVLEARHAGRPVWCAEIVVIAPEDQPERLAALLQPAVVEVLLLGQAAPEGIPPPYDALATEDRLVARAEIGVAR